MGFHASRAVFAAGVVSLALIAGCGSDDDETTTAIETSSATGAPATTTEPSPDTEQPGPGQKPPPEPEPQELTRFSTPSGNIGCVMDPEYVRCDIRDRDWEPPPAPADCELDFGHGIELANETRAQLVCAGDTTLGGEDLLEYGETSRVGPYRCVSAAAGITCEAQSGHGFFLSEEAYELF
jgi:hypothetical protein